MPYLNWFFLAVSINATVVVALVSLVTGPFGGEHFSTSAIEKMKWI